MNTSAKSKKIEPKFQLLSNVGNKWGGVDAIRQALAMGELPGYLECKFENATWRGLSAHPYGSANGSTKEARWTHVAKATYQISGWFRLDRETVRIIGLNEKNAHIEDVELRPDGCEKFGPDDEFLIEEPIPVSEIKLSVRSADLLRWAADQRKVKVPNREYNNMLRIIAALCTIAGIDISKHTVAASQVAATLDQWEEPVGAETIGNHFKAARAFIPRRNVAPTRTAKL